MRPIDANELTEMVWRERVDTRERIAELIARQPTIKAPAADTQPIKHGWWDGYFCSECNVCADYFVSGDFWIDRRPNYCPNCGTRMDGEKNETD